MAQEITISEAPERLQSKVNEYLHKFEGSKTLTVKRFDDTPYKDKSIKVTRYVAFLEHGNLLTTLKCEDCSDKEFGKLFSDVKTNSMIAGYMQVFFEKSWWFGDGKSK